MRKIFNRKELRMPPGSELRALSCEQNQTPRPFVLSNLLRCTAHVIYCALLVLRVKVRCHKEWE